MQIWEKHISADNPRNFNEKSENYAALNWTKTDLVEVERYLHLGAII